MKNNGHDYWVIERWRFALALFGALLGGLLSGYWLISLVVALSFYIGWLLFKLQQLHNWLEHGSKPSSAPDSNGIWERVNYHIQNTQKKSDIRKKRMARLLKRFQGIITSLPYATVVLTGKNEIDWSNKHATWLLKLNLKTDRGQRLENLVRAPQLHQLLNNNKQKEIEINSPFDEQTQLAMQLIPIEQDLKLLIARDISERVSIQEIRKNFIANASHELRTPLTVIAGYLEIMQDDKAFPERLFPAVQAASKQSMRMQRIIEDLLTLSTLENSELDEEKVETINMAEIIEAICKNETLIDKHMHTLSTHLDPELSLSGITNEIISVCTNLIQNAVRYTPKGTHVDITWQQEDNGKAVFSVKDYGEGIAPEHLSHLTERFYRVDKGRSRDTGGTGLGLAIVQHIIERHGGKLDIKSDIGRGSVFSAVFPEQ